MGTDLLGLCAPQPLTADHQVDTFGCGEHPIDQWLRTHALTNQVGGYSRTFVVCADVTRVVGFYCLSAGSVDCKLASFPQAPKQVPVVVLGRLGVTREYQSRGLGGFLVRDALLRAQGLTGDIGVRAMLVHALHSDVARWYTDLGFDPSPSEPLTLMRRLELPGG